MRAFATRPAARAALACALALALAPASALAATPGPEGLVGEYGATELADGSVGKTELGFTYVPEPPERPARVTAVQIRRAVAVRPARRLPKTGDMTRMAGAAAAALAGLSAVLAAKALRKAAAARA